MKDDEILAVREILDKAPVPRKHRHFWCPFCNCVHRVDSKVGRQHYEKLASHYMGTNNA